MKVDMSEGNVSKSTRRGSYQVHVQVHKSRSRGKALYLGIKAIIEHLQSTRKKKDSKVYIRSL
jgi:hypothetical protein